MELNTIREGCSAKPVPPLRGSIVGASVTHRFRAGLRCVVPGGTPVRPTLKAIYETRSSDHSNEMSNILPPSPSSPEQLVAYGMCRTCYNKTRRDRNRTGPGLLRVHAFVSLRPYRNRNRVPAFGAVYSPFRYGSKLIVKFLEGVLELLSYRNRFGSFQISARGDKPI